MERNTLPLPQPLAEQYAVRPTAAFDRVSWAVLALALLLVGGSAMQKVYRFTLPTDGWAFVGGTIGGPDQDRPVYTVHVLDEPSPLQSGDKLLAVEGRRIEDLIADAEALRVKSLPLWRAGSVVRYTVERNGRPVSLDVQLTDWTWTTLLPLIFTRGELYAALPLAVIGWVVFLRRPQDMAARALVLFSVCLVSTHISAAGINWSVPELLRPGLYPIAVFFSNWIFAIVMMPSLLLLTLSIPHPRRPLRRWPLLSVAVIYGTVPALMAVFGPLALIGWVTVLVMCVLSLGTLVQAVVAVGDPVARAQLRWAVSGLAVLVLLLLPTILGSLGIIPALPPWFSLLLFGTGMTLAAGGFANAILRYRLFDIDIIINRALVYGALTAFVVGSYIGIVGYLGALLQVTDRLFPSLIATGVVAVLFQPLRERVQRGVNRLLYGERDEPYAVLTRLGQRLHATLDPDAVLPTIVETVATALKLPYAAIQSVGRRTQNGATDSELHILAEFLDQGSKRTPSGSAPRHASNAACYTVPLLYQGEEVGQLLLAPRPGETHLSAHDQRLLDDLAQQVGVAIHAVRLTADLRRSRERLVSSREEERRRLRRDLHDGLGPTLSGVAQRIDLAATLVPRDPERSVTMLHDLQAQVRAAIADIRRLVDNLRPPALDQYGLVGAIREETARIVGPALVVSIDASDYLPALPAAIEVAAYRIVMEAVTNVVRHAQASCCTVSVHIHSAVRQADQTSRMLTVEIRDDGRGIAVDAHAGVGLRSMRERAEELGGTCVVDARSGAGTCITASLPLERPGTDHD